MRNYRTTAQLSVILILTVILLASSVGATPLGWRTRQGTVGWALSLQDGTHVYLDAVIIDKIRANIPNPYFTVRECFYAADRLVILSAPSTLLRMGQLIDVEGDLVTLPNGDRGLQNVTVWGYKDKDGVLLTRGGPLSKGIWNRTTWDYMVDLTVSTSVRAATEPSSNDEPNTDPAERPNYYPNISDILDTESARTQSFRTQSYYDGIPGVRGLSDGSLVELECKGITAAGTENIGGTHYNYFDMIENPPATDTIRCYYSGTASVTDRVNKITGQIRHVGTEPVICVDTGPDYDPQILKGGCQLVSQGSLAWVKTFPDGTQLPAGLPGKVVSGDFNQWCLGYFFIQESSGASGIRVDLSPNAWWWFWFSPGAQVTIAGGQVTTVDNQRAIIVDTENIEWLDFGTVNPLGLNNRAVAGGPFNVYTPGATDAFGLNNVGLLIKTWGLASNVQPSYFYINDGSDDVGVKIDLNMGYYNISHSVQAGDYAAVTGIAQLETVNDQKMRVIKPRDYHDIVTRVPHFTNITVTPDKAGVGEIVDISFNVDQTLAENPTVTVNGHSATYYGGGYYSYTYRYTVSADDPAGWATIAISGKGSGGLSGSATKSDALWITDATFDDNGNRRTSRDPRGFTYYEYDVLRRLIKVTYPDGSWIAYEYDLKNNRTKMTVHLSDDPLVEHITDYKYNNSNKLWKVYDQLADRDTNGDPTPSAVYTSYTYKDNGLLDTITYPNGTKTVHSYNSRNLLTSISNRKSDNTIIAEFAYSYDATHWGKNGTKTKVIENILKPDGSRISAQVDYEYDDLYRLTREHRTAYSGGDPGVVYDYYYAYDAAGNRTSWQVAGGATTNYTYDAANKMTGPGSFTYDDKGNTLTHTIGGITTSYTWDYLNRLTRWEKTGETTQDYVYNGDGMRVRKTLSGGTVTDFLLDGVEVAEELTGENNIAYVGRGLISRIVDTVRTVYHADSLGSTRAISDNSQAIQEAVILDAYGNVQSGFAGSSSFGYAGKWRYYTDANGLHYLKARYYDSSVGRFISRDPIGFKGGFNLYAYVENCPVTSVDPSGLQCCRGGDTSCPDCKQEYNVCMADALNQYRECFQSVFGASDLFPGGLGACAAGCAVASLWNGELTFPVCLASCSIASGIYTAISWTAARWACAGPYERAMELCDWQCQNCRHNQ